MGQVMPVTESVTISVSPILWGFSESATNTEQEVTSPSVTNKTAFVEIFTRSLFDLRLTITEVPAP